MSVLEEVASELEARNDREGDDNLPEADWLDYIHVEIMAVPERFRPRGELRGAYPAPWDSDAHVAIAHMGPLSKYSLEAYRKQLVSIAALAVAAVESFDRLGKVGLSSDELIAAYDARITDT